MLALLSAVALAFLLSRRLSTPLAVLAEGTQAVARGDFSRRAPVTSRDELGILTQSFNSMTQQLGEARSVAQLNQAQLETAKGYLGKHSRQSVRGGARFRSRPRPADCEQRGGQHLARERCGADRTEARQLAHARRVCPRAADGIRAARTGRVAAADRECASAGR